MIIDNVMFNAELEEIISELRNELTLNHIQLLSKIKTTPTDIMVCCPYHKDGQERNPSAGIRKEDGMFHCFACGETHTLPEVISHCFCKDITGAFGWKWLLKNFGTVSIEERKDIELDFSRKTLKTLPLSKYPDQEKMNELFEEELESYRYIHPYMYERKLTDEIIEMFDIGYDKMSDCITFPIRDINGTVLAVARRSTKGKWFNYPSGFEKPLYGIYELTQSYKNKAAKVFDVMHKSEIVFKNGCVTFPQELIVCESMIDALTCWVYGKYAVALNGLGTELQFKQLRELPCRKLILATDNDEAGMRARKRIKANVKNKLISEYMLPKGKKDINELTREEFLSLKDII